MSLAATKAALGIVSDVLDIGETTTKFLKYGFPARRTIITTVMVEYDQAAKHGWSRQTTPDQLADAVSKLIIHIRVMQAMKQRLRLWLMTKFIAVRNTGELLQILEEFEDAVRNKRVTPEIRTKVGDALKIDLTQRVSHSRSMPGEPALRAAE